MIELRPFNKLGSADHGWVNTPPAKSRWLQITA